MKSTLNFLMPATVICASLLAGCTTTNAGTANSTLSPQAERGRYLVTAIGCNDCHTPLKMTENGPEPDMTRMLSGHPASMKMPRPPKLEQGPWMAVSAATNTAFSGPWGVSFAVNLTPDQDSGLGIWTEDMFLRAIRTGKHMGVSRPIMPPMPWASFRNLNDEDLKSIYAYLRTVPPIRNRVPQALEPPEVEAELH